jgi:dihydrofolate reductase
MRKLIMWNMVTLDGLFEGSKSWDLGWHNYFWGEELAGFVLDQLKTAGALLFGRTTYEGMAAYWTTAEGEAAEVAGLMNSLPKYVFSGTLEAADWNNSTLITSHAREAVQDLKQQDGKDLFIFGSAYLTASMMSAGLIDEFRLGLNPILLGRGTPLFARSGNELRLKLLEARPFQSGVVLLRYAPVGAEGSPRS